MKHYSLNNKRNTKLSWGRIFQIECNVPFFSFSLCLVIVIYSLDRRWKKYYFRLGVLLLFYGTIYRILTSDVCFFFSFGLFSFGAVSLFSNDSKSCEDCCWWVNRKETFKKHWFASSFFRNMKHSKISFLRYYLRRLNITAVSTDWLGNTFKNVERESLHLCTTNGWKCMSEMGDRSS